jgi:DNA gyrase/topoisomerase IV subunit A
MSPAQFFQLKADEWICTFAPWRAIKQQERLVLVTSLGYARIYPLEGLVESVEGPAPLQFDQPLPGLPHHTAGASDEDHLVVALDSGRAVRYRLVDLPLQGIQTINRRDDERIVAARVVQAGGELLLVTTNGYGKRLPVQWIPQAPKANSRGRVIISRRPLAGAACFREREPVWALTAKQLWPLSGAALPEETAPSTRSYRVKVLGEAAEILALVERQ